MQQPRCHYVLPEDSQSQTQPGTPVALLGPCAPIRPLARRRECDPTIRHNRRTVDHANSARRPCVAAGYERLGIEDSIPDTTTLWLYREKLAKAGLIEKLFDCFDQHLAAKGYMARGGQIIDASIVPVPTQRNSRDENAELQAGRTPAAWK